MILPAEIDAYEGRTTSKIIRFAKTLQNDFSLLTRDQARKMRFLTLFFVITVFISGNILHSDAFVGLNRVAVQSSCARLTTKSNILSNHNAPRTHARRALQMSAVVDVNKPALKIIIAGAPAAGKGTQCEQIKDQFGVIHLSTGDILRAAVKEGTPLGKEAKSFMDNGQLVPDELITNVVCDRLRQEDCKTKGWLLDGFPRTRPQADALSSAGFTPDSFILLDVPEDILVERVSGRRTDPVSGQIYHLTFKPPPEDIVARLVQRSDDTKEKIVVRYREFLKHVDSIKDCYDSKCLKVDGTRSASEVSSTITEGLKETQRLLAVRRKNYILLSRVISIASLYGFDKALTALFKTYNVPFPPSLAGMLALFLSLQSLYAVCPPGSDMIARFFSPTVALIKAWLPFLFVPPLVILPIKRALLGSAKQSALLVSIITAGAIGSIASAGVVAEVMRSIETSIRTGALLKSQRKPSSEGAAESSKPKLFHNHIDLTPEQLSFPLPPLSSPKVPGLLAAVMLANAVYLAKTNALTPITKTTLLKLFGVYSTIASFLAASRVPKTYKKVAHPVLTTALLTYMAHAVASVALGLPLDGTLSGYFGSNSATAGAGDLISSFLGPAIISFGLQLYTYRTILFQNSLRLVTSTLFASVFGLVSSAFMARIAALAPAQTALSLLTRCITTPLALAGASLTGADASLSALVVVLTGLLGAAVGNSMLEVILPKVLARDSEKGKAADPISVGLAIGAGAHGLGTAAVAEDPLKFASAVVSMSLTGIWTVALLAIPAFRTNLVKLTLG